MFNTSTIELCYCNGIVHPKMWVTQCIFSCSVCFCTYTTIQKFEVSRWRILFDQKYCKNNNSAKNYCNL